MHLQNIKVRNFRLLQDISIILEEQSTVIVGRNNSGKTSLTEVMKRILNETPVFRLEDFSVSTHPSFWDAFVQKAKGLPEEEVRKILPSIEINLTFSYKKNEAFGALSDFIVDLNPACTEALVVIKYRLKDGKLDDFFADFVDTDKKFRPEFFRALREKIPHFYGASVFAIDPNDPSNEKSVDTSALRSLCGSGFINAQRGLDDTTNKDRAVIGKVLENLFTTAKANEDDDKYTTAQELDLAVKAIQEKIGEDFNKKLNELLPALAFFGYPGLSALNTELLTETTLDVERLLNNHTKLCYKGDNGVHLPESYNGLGARNIILILLQLHEFFKNYLAMETRPAVHLVFIEEPEVHLHPQMQEVFIRHLGDIAEKFSAALGHRWPVQFVVSTHSSHIANEAHFETIRYFLATSEAVGKPPKTIVKDLRQGLAEKAKPDRDFLHQYMTLTRCDLFFADKAVLIEGTTERLLLPKIIQMIDKEHTPNGKTLGTQYLSILEIGGAYAHIFFDLLEFLDLRTLIITDIDTVAPNGNGKKCLVSQGKRTSNACIKAWFNNKDIEPTALLAATDAQKIIGKRRLAYQLPEVKDGACGRSFEDAFMLANETLFPCEGSTVEAREEKAWEEAQDVKKSEFALQHAMKEGWKIPHYIRGGLIWLAENDMPLPVIIPSEEANAK
jgi:putative ATP-dependent endonuclease of the OLD family